MRAIQVHEAGGPEVLRYEEIPDPVVRSGEVLVRIEAVGVNYADNNERRTADVSKGPVGVGGEGAGTVVSAGPGVTSFKSGDRVAWWHAWDSYAELIAVSEASLLHLPDGVSAAQAAAGLVQGMTAHYLALSAYPLDATKTCLVQAAAGGVGLMLCQIAKLQGATVIGTVSSPEKARAARDAGAGQAIIYTDVDFEDEVKRLTGGRGVDVVYDSVGQTTFLKGFGCLAPRGIMVSFGRTSGPIDPFDSSVLRGSLYLTRTSLAAYTSTPEERQWRIGDVLGWIASGALQVHIHQSYPLSEASAAHAALQNRETIGKVLLIP